MLVATALCSGQHCRGRLEGLADWHNGYGRASRETSSTTDTLQRAVHAASRRGPVRLRPEGLVLAVELKERYEV